MQREVVTALPGMPLLDLARLLRRHRVSGAPVVDEGGAVVGTVSVSDLIWQIDAPPLAGDPTIDAGLRWTRQTVADVMTPDVFGVEPEASLAELARFFARTGLRRAIVLRGRELAGVVSVIDLLGVVVDRLDRVADTA